jgi:phosphocarrier protein HPr
MKRPRWPLSDPHNQTNDYKENLMPEKTVIVGSAIGLHARPAAIIAEAVVNAGVPVTLSLDGGEPVDAGSALMIMTLGAGNAAQVTVHSDDEETLKKIAELVQQDLDA